MLPLEDLGLVQYGIGIAWLTESIRWHCPRGVVANLNRLPKFCVHLRSLQVMQLAT